MPLDSMASLAEVLAEALVEVLVEALVEVLAEVLEAMDFPMVGWVLAECSHAVGSEVHAEAEREEEHSASLMGEANPLMQEST